MPKQRETYPLSEGDQTWLGSTRGITTNRTEYIVPSDFPAEAYADGYIKSGYPLAMPTVDDGPAGPFTGGEGEVFAGFLFTDQVVGADLDEALNVPVMDHGRVRTSRLPVASFTAPAAAANNTTIVFVD